MKVAFERNGKFTKCERYDVYEVDDDGSKSRSFDDLVFIQTVDSLPACARRINGGRPANSEYVATYELTDEAH